MLWIALVVVILLLLVIGHIAKRLDEQLAKIEYLERNAERMQKQLNELKR